MSSTRTQWTNLEKIEDGTVDWGTADGTRMDEIDQGLGGNYFRAAAAEHIDVATMVGFTTAQSARVARARIKKTSGKTRIPAAGLAVVGTSYGGEEIMVLRRGFYEYAGWSWTPGAKLFLGPDDGSILQESDDNILGHESDEVGIYQQRIGYAVTATRVFIDVTERCRANQCLVTASPIDITGLTFTIATISGARALTLGLGANDFELYYQFVLPSNFRKFAGLNTWALRARYAKTAGTVLDSGTVLYDGAGNQLTLTAQTGWTSATFAWREWHMDQIAASPLTFAAGQLISLAMNIDANSGALELQPQLQLRYIPQDGGF